jgi:type III secretion system FlhB-like substrate exporter
MSNVISRVRAILLPIAQKHKISVDEAADILLFLLDASVRSMIREMGQEFREGKDSLPRNSRVGAITELIQSIAEERNVSIEQAAELLRSLLDPDVRNAVFGNTSFKKMNN